VEFEWDEAKSATNLRLLANARNNRNEFAATHQSRRFQ
jgi:hypothetical protein